ncbi:MAG: response regulator [Promethearchaeota archaeon]
MKETKQKFIGLYLDERTKKKWLAFAKSEGFHTLSKLIREAVNFFIDYNLQISYIKNISELSSILKKPLTSIKGFSQLILEDDKKKLNEDTLTKIREIFNSSVDLEIQINKIFEDLKINYEDIDILIIDKDITSSIILSEWFKRKGYKTIYAKSGEEGIMILKKTSPKFVFIDIVSLDKEFIKIIDEIKKISSPHSKIFLISALAEKDLKNIVKMTKVDGYFVKPFDLRKFDP